MGGVSYFACPKGYKKTTPDPRFAICQESGKWDAYEPVRCIPGN